ncbi:hypothetical protein BH11PSE3_BH11PSE3_02000 [soil metagenome]
MFVGVDNPSTSRRWLYVIICFLSLAAIGGCRPRQEVRIVDPAEFDVIKVGEVIPLRGLLKKPVDQICLLSPYRDRLDDAEPLSRLVNDRLKQISLELQDGAFGLVFVSGDEVEVQLLSGARYNIVPWHESAGRILKPLGCARTERIFVTKVQDLWPALVFGEER